MLCLSCRRSFAAAAVVPLGKKDLACFTYANMVLVARVIASASGRVIMLAPVASPIIFRGMRGLTVVAGTAVLRCCAWCLMASSAAVRVGGRRRHFLLRLEKSGPLVLHGLRCRSLFFLLLR